MDNADATAEPAPAAPHRKIILASGSPRRLDLLAKAGYEVEVVVPGIPEQVCQTMSPTVLVECLAYSKARFVAERREAGIVLGADTVTVLDDEIIGKPDSPAHARQILHRLSGTSHEVVTGVCLIDAATQYRVLGHDVTRIEMRPMSDQEIDEYVASGEAMGKAGAYAIQERADRFVRRVSGSFTNVVGLPMELVPVLIKQLDKRLEQDG